MAWPDSRKKAPNVFFNTYDGTVSSSNNQTSAPVSLKKGLELKSLYLESDIINVGSLSIVDANFHTVNTIYTNDTIGVNSLPITSGYIGTYYTTVLYPILVTDTLNVNNISSQGNYLFGNIVDDLNISPIGIVNGTLDITIQYINYTYWLPEDLNIAPIGIVNGTLAVTINYINYTQMEDLNIAPIGIVNGTLAVTINYINYTYWLPEDLNIAPIGIINGTLS